jgi:hypothetical protein
LGVVGKMRWLWVKRGPGVAGPTGIEVKQNRYLFAHLARLASRVSSGLLFIGGSGGVETEEEAMGSMGHIGGEGRRGLERL